MPRLNMSSLLSFYSPCVSLIFHLIHLCISINSAYVLLSNGDVLWAGWTLMTLFLPIPYAFVACINLINQSDYSVTNKCLLASMCVIFNVATPSVILLREITYKYSILEGKTIDSRVIRDHICVRDGRRMNIWLAMGGVYPYAILTTYINCQILHVGDPVEIFQWLGVANGILELSIRLAIVITSDMGTASKKVAHLIAILITLTASSRILLYSMYSIDNLFPVSTIPSLNITTSQPESTVADINSTPSSFISTTSLLNDSGTQLFTWQALQLIMVLGIEGFVYFAWGVIMGSSTSMSVDKKVQHIPNTTSANDLEEANHTQSSTTILEMAHTANHHITQTTNIQDVQCNTHTSIVTSPKEAQNRPSMSSPSQIALLTSIVATPIDCFTIPGCVISGINLGFALGGLFLEDIPLLMRMVVMALSSITLLINSFIIVNPKLRSIRMDFQNRLEKIFN